MMGQIGGGNPAQIFRSWAGDNPYRPVMPTMHDSEGVVLGRMQQEQADRDRDLRVQTDTANRLNDNANRAADRDVQLRLGMAPIDFKREVFGQVSPLLTGLLTGSTERVGGQSGAAPAVARGPIWTDQMIGEQINAGRGANLAAADTQNRAAATKMAGQGFGTRSPLLAALQGATNMQAAAANSDLARETRWDAAQGNADQTYRTDQLAVQAWNQAEQQDIQRRNQVAAFESSFAAYCGQPFGIGVEPFALCGGRGREHCRHELHRECLPEDGSTGRIT